MFMSLLMTMSYSCNLKAHLAVDSYEKPIDTVADIVANGKTVYMYDALVKHRSGG